MNPVYLDLKISWNKMDSSILICIYQKAVCPMNKYILFIIEIMLHWTQSTKTLIDTVIYMLISQFLKIYLLYIKNSFRY